MKFNNIKGLFLTKALAVLFLLASLNSGQAQTEKKNEAVFFNVSVTDNFGRPVTGLKPENFQVYDEKELRPITHFSDHSEPVAIGILLDVSGSMRERTGVNQAMAALEQLIKTAHSDNEYFLMTFAQKYEIPVDYTQGNAAFLKKIEKLSPIEPYGNTLFYEALFASLDKISQSKHSKRALIAISDGEDNGSKIRFKEIKNLLKKLDVSFYSVSVLTPHDAAYAEALKAQTHLDELASVSGGKSFYPINKIEVAEVFARISSELGSRYKIGFSPTEPAKGEKFPAWRNVKIKVQLPSEVKNIGKIYARTREGYYLSDIAGQ